MRYLPHTEEEIRTMLAAAGAPSLASLFDSIPPAARPKAPLALEPALDEPTLMRHVEELSAKNQAGAMLSFLGSGNYDHHFPPAADQLLLRSEFYTAYTPYQPEVAQGTLQVIFEFQTIVSEVLGLPLANASMYDGASAMAEAVLMARRLTGREKTLLSAGLHPDYRETLRTYVTGIGEGESALHTLPVAASGAEDVAALVAALDESTACVVVGYPSFYGAVTDLRPLVERAHAVGALVITATLDPFAFGLVESPGGLGVDIAVAEGQALGLPPQFGGPGVGLFACRNDRKYLQQVPGRIVGETVDKEGRRGYVLTLATREQHIRRERATSNICTNSGLCATALTIKMAMLGKRGFIEVAEQCFAKAEYFRARVRELSGYSLAVTAPQFHETVLSVRGGDADALVTALARQGIVAGLALGRVSFEPALVLGGASRAGLLVVAITERHTRADLDRLVDALAAYAP